MKRTFDNFPKDIRCPICGTNLNKETFLVSKSGANAGNICEAVCVHLDCLLDNTTYFDDLKIIVVHANHKIKPENKIE